MKLDVVENGCPAARWVYSRVQVWDPRGCRIDSFLSVEVVVEVLKLWWFLKPITRDGFVHACLRW